MKKMIFSLIIITLLVLSSCDFAGATTEYYLTESKYYELLDALDGQLSRGWDVIDLQLEAIGVSTNYESSFYSSGEYVAYTMLWSYYSGGDWAYYREATIWYDRYGLNRDMSSYYAGD
jgi:hypothetical protein